MADEKDLSPQMKWHYQCLAEKAVASLKKNRMEAFYADSREEALSLILDMIPEGSVIGFADSATIFQIGIFDHLSSRKPKEILRPVQWDEEGIAVYRGAARAEIERKVLVSDVYICGINAITLDGKRLSVDGLGNRVAPMIYGPRRTIIVAGANKIVPDIAAARDRVRQICGPVNAKRHLEKHHSQRFAKLPCTNTGFCADCNRPERICCYTVIIESGGINLLVGEEPKKVVIVGEELGI